MFTDEIFCCEFKKGDNVTDNTKGQIENVKIFLLFFMSGIWS